MDVELILDSTSDDAIKTQLISSEESFRYRAFKKFAIAALSGIPWVGGFIAAAVEFKGDLGQNKTDQLQREWLEEHRKKLDRLVSTLNQISRRLNDFGQQVDARLASEEFLTLVEQGFREWDASASEEKREAIRRLLTNAAASTLCSDDLVHLFLDWIKQYHETHFKVIRTIYTHPGISRGGIWQKIHGSFPREDSAEADLFKLLIHDLSLGHVIRQHRPTTYDGQYLKKSVVGRKTGGGSTTMKSAFDGEDPYELTALGSQFVHYVMDEVAPQLGVDATRKAK